MVKPVRNKSKKPPHRRLPVVDDQRPKSKILPRSCERGNPNIPIRTVMYLEIQDMPATDAQRVAAMMLKQLEIEHPHYVVPIRYGKLTTEFEFEGEVLQTARKLCKVNEKGEIVLKDGAKEVDVIRKKI